MEGLPAQLPDDLDALKALLQQQQCALQMQQAALDREQQRVVEFQHKAARQQNHIELLEERLRRLLIHRFGRRAQSDQNIRWVLRCMVCRLFEGRRKTPSNNLNIIRGGCLLYFDQETQGDGISVSGLFQRYQILSTTVSA